MSQDLFEAALAARAMAYAPASKFLVGAAIRGKNGKIYAGCNIENASYPEGWCAETSAISHMIMDGEQSLTEVCVIGTGDAFCTPCGGCRQRLNEFGSRQVPVHVATDSGIVDTLLLGDLLPNAFKLDRV
ncbi:cytidine deaminase [Pararhizobium sp. IMCC21322]|uniref:cytidine deaminase n=1 Tax=Pararhizobium sp. IMCC21322 TaxID=3067903 RepID=UPI002740E68D|nr:cytidine deaminase [Pararhizobium sp. IMCC21322]